MFFAKVFCFEVWCLTLLQGVVSWITDGCHRAVCRALASLVAPGFGGAGFPILVKSPLKRRVVRWAIRVLAVLGGAATLGVNRACQYSRGPTQTCSSHQLSDSSCYHMCFSQFTSKVNSTRDATTTSDHHHIRVALIRAHSCPLGHRIRLLTRPRLNIFGSIRVVM
ncbi:hypothetical protein EDB86DRAFT_2048981 [Lactarius hatsudake]|nr:hypothetical protein EDB86DRAFT_2048981 [Lactarius hatsudake]